MGIWGVYFFAAMPPVAFGITCVLAGMGFVCLLAGAREHYIREGIRIAEDYYLPLQAKLTEKDEDVCEEIKVLSGRLV